MGWLERPVEEMLGMFHDVLVERGAGRDQYRKRTGLLAPDSPGALPRGRDGSRITRHHDGIERSDVDTQFQRVRRNHGADFAVAQLALDLAAFFRQIAAAISA